MRADIRNKVEISCVYENLNTDVMVMKPVLPENHIRHPSLAGK